MYFPVSPIHNKQKTANDDEEIPTLTLAPFTQIPKLSFQGVAVDSLHEIKLCIRNKKSDSLLVNVCFDGPEELDFSISWCKKCIEAKSSKLLELYWCPNAEYSGRYNLKITCEKQLWNVPITFTSILVKKSKKKLSSVLVKKTSKNKQKLDTVSSKTSTEKKPVWNDKPFIPKKIPCGKENYDSNSSTQKLLSSSKILFTKKINKLGATDEDSPNLDDSLEITEKVLPRTVLKGTECNSNLSKKLDSYLETPPNEFCKQALVSSEIQRKDQINNSIAKSPEVIKNLSFETIYKMQRSLNIHSETRIIENSSSDSIFTSIDGNRSVENYVKCGIFNEKDNTLNITSRRYSLNLINNFSIPPSNSKDELLKFPSECSTRLYQSVDSLPEKLKDPNEHNLSTEKSLTGLSFEHNTQVRISQISENILIHSDLQSKGYEEDNSFIGRETSPVNNSIGRTKRRISPEKVFPSKEILTPGDSSLFPIEEENTVFNSKQHFENHSAKSKFSPRDLMADFQLEKTVPKIKDNHSFFPLNEELMNESLRSTKDKNKSDIKFSSTPLKQQNLPLGTWSKVGGEYRTPTSIKRATSLSSLQQSSQKPTKTFAKKKLTTITDPYILAANNSVDPFLSNSIHLDQNWIQKQENRFKNWLNMLLTPPADLNVNDEAQVIDVTKLWSESWQNDVAAAPTKEEVSINYHTSSKLETLRRSAREFYNRAKIQSVLIQVYEAIEKEEIEVREDQNVHLNVGLQHKVMSLLLSYNPLWLRIALETVYSEKLKLMSNSDLLGLSKFLHERFFKDPSLIQKFKSIYNPKYTVEIKKFMLKKYFSIVYFLDSAKINCLIPHDPCLFRKNGIVKESREILIEFTKYVITGAIGDITKYLKYFGYFVEYRQDYIHEFDYAVNSLGSDLRDGVRLTRVMELILLKNDLTKNLRVQAISKLQKIHNVKLVFESLSKAGYQLEHNIKPHHIVEGHREKTLSFLWQIIYKFKPPLVIETTKNIQKWWRSIPISVKRMKLQRNFLAKKEAATKIQKWYRRQKQAENLRFTESYSLQFQNEQRKEKAAIKIQSFYKMHKQQKNYTTMKNAIIKLQEECRAGLQKTPHRLRESAATIIQKNFKRYLERKRFLRMKYSVLIIEKYVLAKKLMVWHQQQYLQIKSSIISIQRWYRSTSIMRKNRKYYLDLKSAVCNVQKRYRFKLIMRKIDSQYTAEEFSTLPIQKWITSVSNMCPSQSFLPNITTEQHHIALKKMENTRSEYHRLSHSTAMMQSYLQAYFRMRKDFNYYLSLKNSVNYIKPKYRANKLMLRERQSFENLKRATIYVQRKFRANKLEQVERNTCLQLEKSASIIQKFFRGYLMMKQTRKKFMELKINTIKIQQRYKAYKLMCSAKTDYQALRKVVIFIQTRVRAIKGMGKQRQEFLKKKESCIIIQRYFRGYSLMKIEKQEYVHLKSVSSFLQQKYRAKTAMMKCRETYFNLKKSCIIIQRRFRANKLMQNQRSEYKELKETTNFIKSKYLANKKMLQDRNSFLRLKKYTILVQRIFRSNKKIKIQRKLKSEQINKSVKIEKNEKKLHLALQLTLRIIGKLSGFESQTQTEEYWKKMQHAVIFVQRRFRANKLMKKERDLYVAKRNATVIIQKYYRNYLLMKIQRQDYIVLRKSAIMIQQVYKAYKKMRIVQTYYQTLRKCVIVIQAKYRSKKLIEEQKKVHFKQRCSICIQKYCRCYMLSNNERERFLSLRTTVKFVQERYRAKKAMEITKESYLKLKQIVMYVQMRFRANQAVKLQRSLFLKQREAAIKIQKYFRGYQEMKKDRKYFLSLLSVVISTQRLIRGFLIRKKYVNLLRIRAHNQEKNKKVQEASATKIQAFWRGYLQRKQCNNTLIEIRKRSENATKEADPQESLESRNKRAFTVIVSNGVSVSVIISALTDFEYVTRRSPEICKKMGPILPEHLYLLIKSVARSLPDIHICEMSTYILINLCKFDQTTAMTWYPEYLDSILNIISHWCDKDNMVFPSLCTLFWLFAHNKEYKKTILQLPNINQRIEKIHSLVLRRQKMIMRTRNVVKSMFISKKPLYLPSMKPDWGFDYPTRPRIFMNSIQAIQCLVKILKMP